MDDYRAVAADSPPDIADFYPDIPDFPTIIPALYPVIPALYPVIPAKAGIQRFGDATGTRANVDMP